MAKIQNCTLWWVLRVLTLGNRNENESVMIIPLYSKHGVQKYTIIPLKVHYVYFDIIVPQGKYDTLHTHREHTGDSLIKEECEYSSSAASRIE